MSLNLTVQTFFKDQDPEWTFGSCRCFFTLLQNVEVGIVFFERELSIPSDDAKEFLIATIINFWRHRDLQNFEKSSEIFQTDEIFSRYRAYLENSFPSSEEVPSAPTHKRTAARYSEQHFKKIFSV